MQSKPKHLQYPRAFSLLEVMIAIAMVLLLMVGVVKVFKYTADTISVGLAVSELSRSQRAAQTSIPLDFAGFQRLDTIPAATPPKDASPGLVIDCTAIPATLDANSTPGTFRTDTLGLFARGAFRRQTANKGSLAADSGMASSLAWIWYGHLWLPDNTGAFPTGSPPPTYPGQGTATNNPNNYYASKWILGRVIIGLRNKNYFTGPMLTDIAAGSMLQDHYSETVTPIPKMAPLGWEQSPSSKPSLSTTRSDTATQFAIYQSRYDLAGIDPNSIVAGTVTKDPFGYFRERTDTTITPVASWWTYLDYRFQADPYPTKPFDATTAGLTGGSAKMARTVPIFMPNCTNFTVEFAGDFAQQNAITGVFISTTPDNETDFDVTTVGPTTVRNIHWYGLGKSVASFGGGARDFERTNTATQYLCAWGGESATSPLPAGVASRPTMLRITITVHDANGRLADDQSFEYIVKLNDTY